MKICHVCAVDFTLKRLLLPLVDAQLEKGNDVISVCSSGPYAKELSDQGYKVKTIAIARSLAPIKAIVTIWKLFSYFRKESFDLVHVHTPIAAFLSRIAAFLAGVPFVVYTAHGFYFHDDMGSFKRNLFIFAEKIMRPLTDLLFTQSSEDAENAILLGIMNKDRTFIIGNGVDIRKFDPDKKFDQFEFNIPENKLVIGMVARLVREKGVVEFLQAAVKISAKYPDVYFLLIGSRLSSDYASDANKEITGCKHILGERLILTGERDDIPAFMARMDIFCLPSWREGMPRSIIEAMMMRIPVVATNIRGSREEVVDGETGFLIPVRNIAKLSEAFELLINNPELRKSMGSRGRQRALELYDEEKVIGRQIDIINKLTSGDLL